MRFWRRKQPEFQFHALATYNAEVARGIQHTEEWKAEMAGQQRAFNLTHYGVAAPEGSFLWVRPEAP